MASLLSSLFLLRAEQLSSLPNKQFFLHSFLPRQSSSPSVRSVPRVKFSVVGNGLFTQTTPEVRRIVHERDDRNLPTVKIVYVVLEAQYQSSLSAAVLALNKSSKVASFGVELALKVKAAVEKERDRLDAVLVFPSMPEVMRLNQLGSFSMLQLGQSKSPFFQLFKRKKQSTGFADSMLKLVRTLP
ncbi:hypothetical protein MLD38_007574 [Melastoma candidum]|uniref:Uncharacterized protein n=1 Tax=Melastoma candidum TaxID=119954 RepID=A0ACB9RR76_9MYRT|nr:hypothetical protein MLD38_007574 [Melastoma candidum]